MLRAGIPSLVVVLPQSSRVGPGRAVNVAGCFGAASFAVVARRDAVAVGGAEAPHFPTIFDRGLERFDALLEPGASR